MNHSELINLYLETSKHSQYQILAEPLRKLIPDKNLKASSRYEKERLNFILQNIPIKDISVTDIGSNTGYFTIEFLSRGASSALVIEGNDTHCEFIREALRLLGWTNRTRIRSQFLNFNDDIKMINSDVVLLLNVLHHVGDDYYSGDFSIDSAKQIIIKSINCLATRTKILIFQLGFNWQGKINQPLFPNGTKKEMIHFIESNISSNWSIESIGIPVGNRRDINYEKVNSNNIIRNDNLGEFLNRPLFILKSRLHHQNTSL